MNSLKNWDLQIDPAVYKILKKTPRRDTKKILEIIKFLPINPYFGDIQKLKGEVGAWRRRAGSYRIFYQIKNSERTILVYRLERRTTNTY